MTSSNAQGESYFSSNYRSYADQNPKRKLDHYISTLSEIASVEKPQLLDIGCGLGSFLARVSETRPNWRLYGTDIRQEAVDGSRAVLGERAELAVAPAAARSFPQTHFDVVTAWDVLEHVEDLDAAMDVIRSMLKPDGSFVFVVPVYDGITGPIIRLLDKDPTHLHKWGRHKWIEYVGLRLDVVRWHGIYRYLVPNGSYVHIPTSRWRSTTPAILGIARLRVQR